RIDTGVDRLAPARPLAALARRPEVDAADQFANHDEIDVFEYFPLEGRGVEQLRDRPDRSDVGIDTEGLPEVEEPPFRPYGRLRIVPLGPADRAQQRRARPPRP